MNSAIPESRLENMATVVLRVLGNCQIHDAECLRIRDAICPNSLCHLTILLIHPLPVSDTQGMACASQRRRPFKLHCPLLQHGTQIGTRDTNRIAPPQRAFGGLAMPVTVPVLAPVATATVSIPRDKMWHACAADVAPAYHSAAVLL